MADPRAILQIEVVKKEIEGGQGRRVGLRRDCDCVAAQNPPGASDCLSPWSKLSAPARGGASSRRVIPGGFRMICTAGVRKSVSARVD
jgi:hypothetical protein